MLPSKGVSSSLVENENLGRRRFTWSSYPSDVSAAVSVAGVRLASNEDKEAGPPSERSGRNPLGRRLAIGRLVITHEGLVCPTRIPLSHVFTGDSRSRSSLARPNGTTVESRFGTGWQSPAAPPTEPNKVRNA
jgi:hypothetical protein